MLSRAWDPSFRVDYVGLGSFRNLIGAPTRVLLIAQRINVQSMTSGGEIDRAVAERLGRCGLRYTAARRSIVHRLRASGPMTLPELLARASDIAQSSAYRNLSQLESAGVVRRLMHDHDHARYELSEAFSEHHHHLICEGCGLVRDVTLDVTTEQALDESCQAVATREGFAVRQHVIDLYGLCSNCDR